MTKLYIMNCKKQDEVFAFRVPELDKAGKVVRHADDPERRSTAGLP